jgi:hypothetical protein
MNCELFEVIVNDLARSRVMEAEKRESGMEHARSCERCAARLADERSLTEGLRALAATRQDSQASPRVEAALLNAFRERPMSQAVNAATYGPSTALVDDIRGLRRKWRVAAGVAAAIFMIALISAVISAIALKPAHAPQVSVGPVAPNSNENRAEDNARPAREEPGPAPVPARPVPVRPAPIRDDRLIARRADRPRLNAGRASEKAASEKAGARETQDAKAAEVATEFMPLAYGYPSSQMARGHIVRVELPRSAMASFGLPVNQERADSRVKADVLIGEDGLARAIRFVR